MRLVYLRAEPWGPPSEQARSIAGNSIRKSPSWNPHAKMHSLEGDSWMRWTHEIRRIEFRRMVEFIPLQRHSAVLELGCGDGFQLALLRERFASVSAIDPENVPFLTDSFAFAFAEALPFGDCTFDLVVSNCVFEHLVDRRAGVREAVRVLRGGGYMAHVVPACYWKATSLLFNPVGYPLRVLGKWCALRQTRDGKSAAQMNTLKPRSMPDPMQVLKRWLNPPVHGTFLSDFDEYRAYQRAAWLGVFDHPQLRLVADVPLFSYTQFGFLRFRLVSLRGWLARRGFASSRALIFQKTASGTA